MPDADRQVLADRLHDAWAELRRLPLGGRGHLADVCLRGRGGDPLAGHATLEGIVAAARPFFAALNAGEVAASDALEKALAPLLATTPPGGSGETP